jgi:hypothetical protein
VVQTCPSASDGPSIVVNAVEDAHRALIANPSTQLPPPCVLTAFARLSTPVPDSLNTHAIDLATAIARRGGNQRELHQSEVLLYSRTHRYAEVSRAYDALVAVDSQPAIDLVRAAVVAAHQRADTTALLHLLTRNVSRSDAPPIFRNELNVLRQTAALHGAINEARGLIRQNPKYLVGYPSLIGNFGTLGASDSVVAYIRRAIAQGATRASLASAIDPLVNTLLRHAALYGSAYGWEPQIAAASRVDSTLTTSSTKFLVASLTVQSADAQIADIGVAINGTSFATQTVGASSAGAASSDRTAGCRRVAPLVASLTLAEAKMRDGGDRYSGGGASQVGAAIAGERSRLAALHDVCARS